MGRKLRILVDMDGIVTDTLPYWLQQIEQTTGVLAKVEDIKHWALHACSPLDQLKPEQIYNLLNTPGFNTNIPAMPDVSRNLELLQKQGHEIYLLTARFGDVGMPETIHWVNKHLPWLRADKQLGFFADKHHVSGDILIDDRAETLIKYQENNPGAQLLTINYPYNQVDIPGIIRVEKNDYTWFSLRRKIEDISDNIL